MQKKLKNRLKINIKKTEVMSLNTKHQARIQLYGNKLDHTTTLTFPGIIVTSDGVPTKI